MRSTQERLHQVHPVVLLLMPAVVHRLLVRSYVVDLQDPDYRQDVVEQVPQKIEKDGPLRILVERTDTPSSRNDLELRQSDEEEIIDNSQHAHHYHNHILPFQPLQILLLKPIRLRKPHHENPQRYHQNHIAQPAVSNQHVDRQREVKSCMFCLHKYIQKQHADANNYDPGDIVDPQHRHKFDLPLGHQFDGNGTQQTPEKDLADREEDGGDDESWDNIYPGVHSRIATHVNTVIPLNDCQVYR